MKKGTGNLTSIAKAAAIADPARAATIVVRAALARPIATGAHLAAPGDDEFTRRAGK